MASWVVGTGVYGEPYYTSPGTSGWSGYTGRYTMVLVLALGMVYQVWVGVQLPQGRYISYTRCYPVGTLGCSIGYTTPYTPYPYTSRAAYAQ